MKSISKLICLFLTMSIFIAMSGYAAQNHTAYINENGEVIETGIDIIVDGAALDFSGVHEPVIIDGRTLIPMRKLFETLNAEVSWDENEQSITASSNGTTVKLFIDNSVMYVNGVSTVLDTAPRLMKYNDNFDTTMVPVRAVSESFSCDVNWDEENYSVIITTIPTETTAPQTEPPTATGAPNISDKIQTQNRVAVYGENIAFIKDDGSVWVSSNGETPVKISGIENAAAVELGRNFGYALLQNGTVYSWGTSNDYGQLGRNDSMLDNTPGLIDGLKDIIKIGSGTYFGIALSSDGTLYTWGRNDKGQLGNGTTTDSTVPVSVSETKFKDAAAGSGHVAAVSTNGTVYTWGENGEGQLGRGSESSKYLTSPGYIKTMYDIESVYAGPNSSAAIRSDKSIYMWGTTYLGQLGKDEKPIILDNNEENLVITDSDGYYKYDKPRRMRYCYWDIDERDYKGGIITTAETVSCGEYQTAALCGDKLYMWGDSPKLSPKLDSQFEHFCAQEYTSLSGIIGIYAGDQKTMYALDNNGTLWKLTYNEKQELFNLN